MINNPRHQLTSAQKQWTDKQLKELGVTRWELTDSMADASFRAYSRISYDGGSFILMHFPPDKEDGERIVASSKFFLANKVQVPQLYSYDTELGVLLQQDFGKELLSFRNAQKIELGLYRKALEQIKLIQATDASIFGCLGEDKLMEEMQLFSKWFVNGWLDASRELSGQKLEELYVSITKQLLTAPQSCAHLDFHSRNLCVVKQGKNTDEHTSDNIGVLDYQDVLQGHFCYDIWSLLRDAYILLPHNIFNDLLDDFINYATANFGIKDKDSVKAQFNLIGIQRCLKVCGIFARLFLRDNKPNYLQHIPLVMDYLQEAINNLSGYQKQSGNIIITNKLLDDNSFALLNQRARDKLSKG